MPVPVCVTSRPLAGHSGDQAVELRSALLVKGDQVSLGGLSVGGAGHGVGAAVPATGEAGKPQQSGKADGLAVPH